MNHGISLDRNESIESNFGYVVIRMGLCVWCMLVAIKKLTAFRQQIQQCYYVGNVFLFLMVYSLTIQIIRKIASVVTWSMSIYRYIYRSIGNLQTLTGTPTRFIFDSQRLFVI